MTYCCVEASVSLLPIPAILLSQDKIQFIIYSNTYIETSSYSELDSQSLFDS